MPDLGHEEDSVKHSIPDDEDASAAGGGPARRGMLLGLAGAATLLSTGTAVAAGSRSAPAPRHGGTVVGVVATAAGVTLTADTVPAGAVTLRVRTPEDAQHPLGLVRLRPDVTLGTFLTHYHQASYSKDPQERRAALALIDSEARYFGGAAVTAASGAVTVTWSLAPGTYHLLDYTVFDPAHPERIRTLTVTGTDRPQGPASCAPHVITPYDAPDGGHYLSAATLPARGTFHVVNHTAQLNEVMFLRTRPDTTEGEITACMEALRNGQNPPSYPFLGSPTGLTPLSPGASAVFSHSLEPGRHLVTSFISNRDTLVKRAFEGMWKLVTLR